MIRVTITSSIRNSMDTKSEALLFREDLTMDQLHKLIELANDLAEENE